MEDIYWLNEESRTFLSRGYLLDGETAEQRIRDNAEAAEKILKHPKYGNPSKFNGFADKFESYLKKGWYTQSSPVWSNFGRERGLPISCFGSFVPDTMDGIMDKISEVGIMTKGGGGTSAFFGDLRPRGSDISSGGKSTGSVHFMQLFDKLMQVVSQGNVRRGSFASYLPVDHPDIREFLKIKSEGDPIQDISIGVCISDEWMKSMISGDKEKRSIWASIIEKKFQSGYPYIFFTDNANNQAPQVYKDKGLKISHSNLCTEIMLSNSETESFVCNLSSLNLEKWDEWKNTDAVETLVFFLDAVMTEFINKTEGMSHMQCARNFAINQRALGIGVVGWHSLLQSKMIAFESMEAKFLDSEIWKTIREHADCATEKLAEYLGEPPLLKGYRRRNVTTLAIAPTTSSSFILGQVSPSIEPLMDNYFVKDLAKVRSSYRNPYLKSLLAFHNKDDEETWISILKSGGSVQHLDFLNEHEKNVFKTFGEISQKEIVIQASRRQKYIDQGQSLNLRIHKNTKPKEVSELMIFAWEQGIKSLYYQRGVNPSQELARSIMECKSCES
jgi:ribonucleoside-diphosphate reductase alpha chain